VANFFSLDADMKSLSRSKSSSVDDNQNLNYMVSNSILLLNQIAKMHKHNISIAKSLDSEMNIAQGAISEEDVRSILKIMSNNVSAHLKVSQDYNDNFRKIYSKLDRCLRDMNGNSKDEVFSLAFSKDFAKITINNFISQYKKLDINSGVFFIKLLDTNNNNETFRTNVYKTFLRNLVAEIRNHDFVAHIGDNVFMIIMNKVKRSIFEVLLTIILEDIHEDSDMKQVVSAAMISSFHDADSLYNAMYTLMKKAETSDAKFLMV